MSISHKPKQRKAFERTVGQAITVTVPADYERMITELNRPRPAVALRIQVNRTGHVTSVREMSQETGREPKTAITLEHPWIVKLVANYTLIERYEYPNLGLTFYDYAGSQPGHPSGCSEAAPALVQTGPGCFIVAEPELLPQLSPAAQEAEGLKAEYPNFTKRIESALALIESGDLAAKMREHGTEWQNLTRHGNWLCDCPDSLHRQPAAKFGRACKHCLAGEILARIKRTRQRVAMQKLASDNERRSAQQDRRYAAALAPDRANLHRDNRAQFGKHIL